MALVIGTNCGFCASAPVNDPAVSSQTVDANAKVIRDTSPATATKITEIGWWCGSTTEEANFEVGLYANDGESGTALTLLEVSRTNAKGTDSGWKRVTVDWTISSSTIYWIGMQLDDTASTTRIDYGSSGGPGSAGLGSQSTLPSPWGTSVFDSDGILAIYAVWEAAPSGTNTQIQIGGAWKDIEAMQIQIGGAWKAVEGAQIQIGGAWKTIY